MILSIVSWLLQVILPVSSLLSFILVLVYIIKRMKR